MKNIAVFCGSSLGKEEFYREQAFTLGQILAEQKIGLVYGGAKVGLMGAVADGALGAGGTVVGVLPYFLQRKEVAHAGLTELVLVDTMHERKLKMQELSDGVIALPGGFGTLEELFEVLTWGQLGLHAKPMALFNVSGFYNPLLFLLDQMVDQGFLKLENRQMLLAGDTVPEVLRQMESYRPPQTGRWITEQTT